MSLMNNGKQCLCARGLRMSLLGRKIGNEDLSSKELLLRVTVETVFPSLLILMRESWNKAGFNYYYYYYCGFLS